MIYTFNILLLWSYDLNTEYLLFFDPLKSCSLSKCIFQTMFGDSSDNWYPTNGVSFVDTYSTMH